MIATNLVGVHSFSGDSHMEEEDADEVKALLMMQQDKSFSNRKEQIIESPAIRHEGDIPTVFQPRFMDLFKLYSSHLRRENMPCTIHEHLFSTCLEHIVPFCTWTRESHEQLKWVSGLLNSPDLRPELRNGIAMILMYTFASAKADLLQNGSDMFTVVMDNTYGLGIIHKTSLRVYNDPHLFFNFLKVRNISSLCMSIPLTHRRYASRD